MGRRGLQTLAAVLLAGLWGACLGLVHLNGEPWFLDRVEATMADLAYTRPRRPQTARGRADRRDRRRNGAPGRQISTQPRHACAHRRRGREILAESRGARHSASRHRRRGGRYGADRGAGPQQQRDCGRRSVRRGQSKLSAPMAEERSRACLWPTVSSCRSTGFRKGLRSASSTYRPTMPARRASFPWSFDPATASRPRFRCRRRQLR